MGLFDLLNFFGLFVLTTLYRMLFIYTCPLYREEQDREFQETLEADRQREVARRDAEAAKEREREEAAEEERLKRDHLERCRSMVAAAEEPLPSEKRSTRIRFTLPSGSKVDRRFSPDRDTVETLHAFLTVYFHDHDVPIQNFQLCTNYPRRTHDDKSATLEEADHHPMAVLMVQDLDS